MISSLPQDLHLSGIRRKIITHRRLDDKIAAIRTRNRHHRSETIHLIPTQLPPIIRQEEVTQETWLVEVLTGDKKPLFQNLCLDTFSSGFGDIIGIDFVFCTSALRLLLCFSRTQTYKYIHTCIRLLLGLID